MGVYAGPDVSESGLVLALDARNNKSHSTNRFISYGSGLVTEGIGFQVNGTGTFQRVAAGTVIGGYTVKTTDVVYSYVLGTNGCHYHGSTAPIPAGVSATMSVDYLVTGATNYPVNSTLIVFENYGGGALSGGASAPNNLQNVWQRVTFTSGPTSSAGTQAMFLYPGGCGTRLADSGTIYFRNPKVEWTNVDTGDGNFSSMSNVTTWYDMSGNGNNGTLTNTPYYFISSNGTNGYMSFDGTDDYVNGNLGGALNAPFTLEVFGKFNNVTQYNYEYFGSVGDLSTNGMISISKLGTQDPNSSYHGFMYVYPGFGDAKKTNIDLRTTNYHHLVIVLLPSSPYIKVYKNGVEGSMVDALSAPINTNGNYRIGTWANNTWWLNGNIASFKVYNRALTTAEVQQNFNANRSRFGI